MRRAQDLSAVRKGSWGITPRLSRHGRVRCYGHTFTAVMRVPAAVPRSRSRAEDDSLFS
jgi:hypothetical protein